MNPSLRSRSKSFIRPPATKSDEKVPNDRRSGLRSGLRSCKSSQSSPIKNGLGSNVQSHSLVVKAEPVTSVHSPSNLPPSNLPHSNLPPSNLSHSNLPPSNSQLNVNGQVNDTKVKSVTVHQPTQVPKLAIVKPAQRSWIDTDYSRYYNDKMYTDVTLKFNARHVKGHKMILASASPIFADLFKDPNCTEVSISTDISYQSFNWMIEFIYTKKIKALALSGSGQMGVSGQGNSTLETNRIQMADYFDLLTAGQVYEMKPLVSFAEELISTRLTEENVIDILTLSFDKKLDQLLDKSVSFIISVGDPCSLDNWKDVYRYRGLIDLLFTRILPKKKPMPRSGLPLPAAPPGVLATNQAIVNGGILNQSRSRSAIKVVGKKGTIRSNSAMRR